MREGSSGIGRAAWRGHRQLVFAVAALLVLGGVATAAIPDSDDKEIHGCHQKNNGQLRVIDAQAGDTCRASEVPLVWNQKGEAGPTGPEGPQGDPGEEGPRGPSDAFSRFHDAEVPATDYAAPRLLERPVPEGNYATTGTAIVRNAGPTPVRVECATMHPSGDFDLARASLAPSGQPGDTQTLTMNPVGTASADGQEIWLDCNDEGGEVRVSWMKITTVQVANLTNTPG